MPTIRDSVNTKNFLPHNINIVTFKEVQHKLESQPDYTSSQQFEMLQRVRGKPFWIWDNANHKGKDRTHRGDCCFTDIIGQQPVKKSSKFDLPGPPTDSHGNVIGDNDIPIAVIDAVNKDVSSTSYKRHKLSPLFKALEKQGFKITSYEER